MRDATHGRWRWQRSRITTTDMTPHWVDRVLTPVAEPVLAGTNEKPGPDGIRRELVARVKQEIAAGTYDTEEKWLAAEEALLRRLEERM